MLFKNAEVIFKDTILKRDVRTQNGKIAEIGENLSDVGENTVNCEGLYLSPGLIDLHVHGGGGFSAMGGKDEVLKMADAHLKNGVTGILPTFLADTPEALTKAADGVRQAKKENSSILGVHFEGPFLSKEMSGAQNKEKIINPVDTDYKRLIDDNGDILRMMGAAPETEGGMELGDYLKSKGIVASVAHSSGYADTFNEAVKHGYSDVTHLFNACTVMKKEGAKRFAGTAEAALANENISVQVIADLIHLPREILKLIYNAKGDRKMYLISDGLELSASELHEGECFMQRNGVEAVYSDGALLLKDKSALAGSIASGFELVGNMYFSVGVPLYSAVRMMSLTPAEVIGEKFKGQIKTGFDADIVLLDRELNIKRVYKNN